MIADEDKHVRETLQNKDEKLEVSVTDLPKIQEEEQACSPSLIFL